MADRKVVVAFAGNGDTSLENATALLNNNLLTDSVDVEGFYIPAAINQRKQKGLANVVSYLTTEWGDEEGDEDPFETFAAGDDLIGELVSAGDSKERYLVVVLGETEPDEVTADMIRVARENDITVLDLAAGLDEYTADGDDAEVAADEPEEAEERPRRRRRTPSTPEPAEAESAPSRGRRQRGTPRTKAENDERAEKTLDELKERRTQAAQDEPPFDPPYECDDPRVASAERPPDQVIGELIAAGPDFKATLIVALEGALAALKGNLGRPQEETFAYIVDDAGNVIKKRGRGKPASGQKVEFLTKTEAAAKGFEE